jgi:hypothetical protein
VAVPVGDPDGCAFALFFFGLGEWSAST